MNPTDPSDEKPTHAPRADATSPTAAERATPDLPAGGVAGGAKEHYHLSELAELLDAPLETVRGWLSGAGAEPVGDDPDTFHADTLEMLRSRQHGV